jgi:hypothetical protein
MDSPFINMIPVLPSANIERDVAWYKAQTGFDCFYADAMYAILYRAQLVVHLQWHADTAEDPLLGGSAIRIQVNNVQALLQEFIERGTVQPTDYRPNTPWRTNEFGFYDLNRNAIFIAEDLGEL